MADLIVTTYKSGILAALKEDGRVTELHVEKEKAYQVGNIYIGKVQNIAKNINAAFVDFGCGINGYLALEKAHSYFYTRQAKPGKTTNGDEIVVQLEKEAIKTKLPVLSGNLNLAGRFAVLVSGQKGIVFSKKLHKPKFEKTLREALRLNGLEDLVEECALIVRTNAASVAMEEVTSEIAALYEKFTSLKAKAPYRTAYSCLDKGEHPFLSLIRDFPMKEELKVVTDLSDFYEDVRRLLPDIDIQLYQDDKLSLTALHSLSTAMERALSKKVYLKSGGDLVIEPTEALTVIDVNTGKCNDKISKNAHILRTNLEAAKELAIQLRLRNYSGMILVDFIDMEDEKDDEKLLEVLKAELAKDRVKTNFVDMTGLHLAELTRKRTYRPLHEMVKEFNYNPCNNKKEEEELP